MRSIAALALILAGWLASGVAFAGPTGGDPPVLQVGASSGDGSDAIELAVPSVPNGDGVTYSASGSGESANFLLDFDLTLNPDPEISGSFSLTNRAASELQFSLSFALPIPSAPVTGSASGYFGAATYRDAGQDSSARIATVDPSPFYAAILGATTVQTLGAFDLNVFGGPGVSGTVSRHEFAGSLPGGVTPGASTLEVRFGPFTLSGGDSVHVPFSFIVVPEPALAWLVGLGALALVGARRARL